LYYNSVLERYKDRKMQTLIFCNTVESSRAVEYSIRENNINATSYHGDLNSRERGANLDAFRNGDVQYLVCTDIAARGEEYMRHMTYVFFVCA
jgi:superfamily II DNA/RNA helicase